MRAILVEVPLQKVCNSDVYSAICYAGSFELHPGQRAKPLVAHHQAGAGDNALFVGCDNPAITIVLVIVKPSPNFHRSDKEALA
jgi:hypothetical protein